ncbi:MAG: hypothetical protein JST80_13655 [Bdellovibrionales bacterium]|nr:hypothetical protein [Bdellovibrionales bacterium]
MPSSTQKSNLAKKFEGFLPPNAIIMTRRPSVSEVHDTTATTVAFTKLGNPNSELLFVSPPMSAGERQLLQKMVEAMGANLVDVGLVEVPADFVADASTLAGPATKMTVSLGVKLAGSQVANTHSLTELSKSADAKKQTWEVLKHVMKELGWAVKKR